ncbi:MAG: 1-acyl-sn-glycerol-3-phosphate acyltransferase [Desulfovibrio sp.]|jgi:1-acyl-sn-glycerol-3-phosphate acyltransferase|nr:1-acyl-sn-glycerol-3-phosphate acyltransferase [Desulfovibrio sp.]
MTRLPYAAKLVWLNVGFYSGMFFVTAVSILFVSVPGYWWMRLVRGCDKGTAVRRLIWLYGRAWTKLLGLFIPLRLENCDKALPRPSIITPNHQSFFDTYCFAFMPEPDVVFAVRAWPFRMPFYGPYMRLAGYLNTEGDSPETLLEQCKSILGQRSCIGVFPEGTRSLDGAMRRFHPGAFHLAVLTDVPIVPVCMDGTGIFLRRGGFLLRPAAIAIRVLDPIHPSQFTHLGDEAPLALRHAVKDSIQKALDDLRAAYPVFIPSNRKKECL